MELGGAGAFFASTPRLMALLVEGRQRAAEATHARAAWQAWTTAACHRAKKMPALKDLIGKPRRPTKPAKPTTADQLLTIARMWSAAAPKTKGG